MKKILISLLSITSISVFAETYQTRIKIGSTLESVFKVSTPYTMSSPHSSFVETGEYGNIALIGTNGLTALSYTESSSHNSDFNARTAFDGWEYDDQEGLVQINEDSSSHEGSLGFWSANGKTSSNEWIAVNFGDFVDVSGFRLIRRAAASSGHLPKDIIIQTSVDGFTWNDYYTTTTVNIHDSGVLSLPSPVVTQYLRLYAINNHSGDYVELNEWEIFQVN
jgi:hypothetical protein